MLELTRVYHFSAGHRLADPALSDEANEALYGACYRPHGHNYYLEVTVAGRPDPVTGMSVDLGRIDGACTSACSTTSITVRWRKSRRWPAS